MRGNIPDDLTAREYADHEHEIRLFELQRDHVQELKRLENEGKIAEIKARIEAGNANRESQERIKQKELDIVRLENKWLRLPITIIKLPLYPILGVAFCICMARKYDPPESFWRLLR